MAEVIEFYVPKHFRQNATWVPGHLGKLIEFWSPKEPVTDERPIPSKTSEGDQRTPVLHVTSS
jgi:hypothetical protein